MGDASLRPLEFVDADEAERRFDAVVDTKRMVGTMTAKIPRAYERKRVLWDVALNQNGPIWKCTAFDISPAGIKIRIAEPLAINSRVVIGIDGAGNSPGEVRWQDRGLAGIRFLEDAAVAEERLQRTFRIKEIRALPNLGMAGARKTPAFGWSGRIGRLSTSSSSRRWW